MSNQEPSENDTEQRRAGAADIAVVICAYTEERWDDIIEAIASVDAQSPPVAEIVLVVDHNEDLFARARARYEQEGAPLVHLVQNRYKRGLSGARNSGIESSKAPIIAFLDDDAVAAPGWVAGMVERYADREVIGMGGAVIPRWLTGRPGWWPPEFDWVVGCSRSDLPTTTTPIRNPIGANMSVRREAFVGVGGFSPAIGRVGKHPVGAEETELFIRIRQRWPEAKVLYEPASAVEHKVPGARATYDYFRARCFAEGLSKAVVSKLVGSGDGLSDERSYTRKTLPLGVLRGIKDGVRGDRAGFGRAGAIVSGLFITTLGYVRGRLARGPVRNLSAVPLSSETA